MSVSALRFCTLNESTLGEPEQDANSALTELDKGLHSNKIGEQCEAIVRFPKLFEKYPFPILINSSFLKLAEQFRVGNNFLRLWIVKVCQQSEKHFDKIINVDEFIRRVFSVIHSNDPVARALTLRTLGSVAGIIPERQNVHHSIRSCLDSHNAVEVEAAIFAAVQFAAQSRSFAVSVCNKISDMIQGLTTPVHMKLQLIPILQHMHHDTATSAMVRTLCIDLLAKYPAQDFVLVTLKTLTQLAAATLVDIPEQVKLLARYVAEEPRWIIRVAAVSGLYTLAKRGSHYWSEDSVAELITVAGSTDSEKLVGYIFDIIIILTQSPAVCHMYYNPDSPLMELCYETSLSNNLHIAGKAVRIITQMACYCYTEQLLNNCDDNVDCVESYLLFLSCSDNNEEVPDEILKCALRNAVSLCYARRQLCSRFVGLIASSLLKSPKNKNLLLCQALCAIGNLEPAAVHSHMQDIFSFLKMSTNSSETKSTLCSSLFQSSAGCKESDEMRDAISTVVSDSNLWSCYKIARSAARYGHFGVCQRICSSIRDRVSSEHLHFWLTGLQEISIAEANLQTKNGKKLFNRISNSITNYCKATSSFKAASTPAFSLSFQTEYARLRCEMLQSFSLLLATCNVFCLSPPPAIASTIIQNTRDDLQRYGQVTNQLRKRAKELKACADLYWKLYQSAFDADPNSLLNIKALQYMCTFVANNVEQIAFSNSQLEEIVLNSELLEGPLEIQLMVKSCKAAYNMKKSLNLPGNVLTHQHISCLKKQVKTIILAPMCYPRFFFQALQCTNVTLAVSPQPRSGEHISVTSGTQLAVKVEGVLSHGSKPILFRSADGIVLTVTTQLTARSNAVQDFKMNDGGPPILTQTVKPHRDFFRAEFLLGFTSGGQYQVVVEAAIIDNTGFTWQIGVRSVLNIKALEETQSSRGRAAVN
ncbi:integrator complex subunit 7 [Planococcus citri]|uniref:integrator complex subunit 7 n=1 Tax=Planococcus citri TaxID=170843 RepID=UPI0031F8FFE9